MIEAKLQIGHSDLHRVVAQAEYPEVFTIGEVDQYNRTTLVHHVDGQPTSIRITLSTDGTWSAFGTFIPA